MVTLPPGTKIPNHVVIIPDGDRRWARLHGISSSEGQHKAGITNLANLARFAREWGIHTVSAWDCRLRMARKTKRRSRYPDEGYL